MAPNPLPIPLDTLKCRYVPCLPPEDQVGFVDVTWTLPGIFGPVGLRLATPVLLHRGMLVYRWALCPVHLDTAVVQKVLESYETWEWQQHIATAEEDTAW